ncbi:MAG: class I SAM-dependent DNA methyltransferase [Dehalococcoidia bacterium]
MGEDQRLQDPSSFLTRVYSASGLSELAEIYDDWAHSYDKETIEDWGRRAPDIGARILSKHVPPEAKILDAGVGTGLVGKILQDMGYTNIVGIDISQGMLAEARAKNIYTDLHKMTLGETLDFTDNEFDALICIGVFTHGHAGPDAFDEIVRVVRPGGKIVFGLGTRLYGPAGFKDKQDSLVTQGKWVFMERSQPFSASPKVAPQNSMEVWVYEVTA